MIWIAATLLLFAASGIAIVTIRRRRGRRTVSVIVPEDLAERVESAARAFASASPWQPAASADAPAAAASIEAALIAGEPPRALEAAESALAAAPDAAAGRVWLAWALCANGQPAGALHQLARVGAGVGVGGGGGGSVEADPEPAGVVGGVRIGAEPELAGPLAAYVAARAEHLRFEHDAGAIGPVPPLVTTADLAILTLASGRGAATWLTGSTEVQLSADQVRAAIAEHREITARCLSLALSALEAAPGFTDAAYLVARLAVKAGLLAAGRALFDAIAPRIAGRPDADAFERDRKDLADPASAVAAAKTAPVPAPSPTAKRSKSLRVLS